MTIVDSGTVVPFTLSEEAAWPPRRVTVVYDEQCVLCRRCRRWLSAQSTYVEVAFLAAGSDEAFERYGDAPWFREELVVVADTGHAWIGSAAFIMCLWATARWRPLSYRLRGAAFAPMAEFFFHSLSSNRSVISGMLKSRGCDAGTCQQPES